MKRLSAVAREHDTKSLVMASVMDIEQIYASHGGTGLTTGFKKLDELTGGLQKGELIVVGGRPSMGKSSFALNIVEHLALDQKRSVAVFSLELTGKQLTTRLLCSRARINGVWLRRGILSEGDITRLTEAATAWGEARLHIVDAYPLTVADLVTCARKLRADQGVELVVVDHLQLLSGRRRSRVLKEVAKELDVPVLVLSPLNRGPEGRAGGRPRTSDLREASSVETDADVIALLLRHEYYAVEEDARATVEGHASLFVAKQRQGPVGQVELVFQKETMRFAEMDFPDETASAAVDPP